MNKFTKSPKDLIIMTMIFVGFVVLYSWALMDPNFTLFNHPYWNYFRNFFIRLGYQEKSFSIFFYLASILCLYVLYFFSKKINPYKIFTLSILVASLTIFSYPFLTHDLFNYLFDAKIITIYHANPYIFAPQFFQGDQWLRFMHWVHRTYPYGPTFLVLSVIPVFLASGKLVLSFFFYKIFNALFYLIGVYSLIKIDKKSALIFAFHPLIIVEGLINAHNDLIAVGIGLLGFALLIKNNEMKINNPDKLNSNLKFVSLSYLLLLISGLIKFFTLPILFIFPKNKFTHKISLILLGAMISYISFTQVTQPWYLINLFLFLPFFPKLISNLEPFLFSLLISYIPYIFNTGWGEPGSVSQKNQIIIVGLTLNILWLLFTKRSKILGVILAKQS